MERNGTGLDGTGRDRTGQDRTGQDRTGKDRTEQNNIEYISLTRCFVGYRYVRLIHLVRTLERHRQKIVDLGAMHYSYTVVRM
jgi:hypothetical protein